METETDNAPLYYEALDDLSCANVSGGELEMLAAYLAKLREE